MVLGSILITERGKKDPNIRPALVKVVEIIEEKLLDTET